jgi:hypothetical protein
MNNDEFFVGLFCSFVACLLLTMLVSISGCVGLRSSFEREAISHGAATYILDTNYNKIFQWK